MPLFLDRELLIMGELASKAYTNLGYSSLPLQVYYTDNMVAINSFGVLIPKPVRYRYVFPAGRRGGS